MGKSCDLGVGWQLHPTIAKEATDRCTKEPTGGIAGTGKLRGIKHLSFKFKYKEIHILLWASTLVEIANCHAGRLCSLASAMSLWGKRCLNGTGKYFP